MITDDVQLIRYAALQGESAAWIAQAMHVSELTVINIIARDTYHTVPSPDAEETEMLANRYDELKFWEAD